MIDRQQAAAITYTKKNFERSTELDCIEFVHVDHCKFKWVCFPFTDLSADRLIPVSKALATVIMEDLSPASAACSRYLNPFILFPALSLCKNTTTSRSNHLKINVNFRWKMQYLDIHIWQDVMGQLQTALTQGYDRLQLSALGGSLQV